MPALFDGVTSLLAGVFGDPVTWLPLGGGELPRHWVFRESQVERGDDEGHTVLDVMPVLRVPGGEAAGLGAGDRIRLADGRLYRVVNGQPGGSPAADSFVFFELERAA